MGSFRFHFFGTPIVFSFVTDLYSKIVESMHLELAFVSCFIPAKGFAGMKQLLKNQSCKLVRLKQFEIDISMTDCTQGWAATELVLVRAVSCKKRTKASWRKSKKKEKKTKQK